MSTPSTPLLADLLRAVAADEPDREAYVHAGKRATYAWLDGVADGFAATLLDHGVGRGDRVCLMLPSSIKFAGCYLGAARVGAITSAVNLRLGPAEQASIVARTEPAVTVVGDDARVPDGVDPGRVLPVTALKEAFGAAPPARLPDLAADDPVCIIWTSGTTGIPKGAVHTHDSMAAITRNVVDMAALHDRVLFTLPFPHLGYMGWIHTFTQRRVTLVLGPQPWSAPESLRVMAAEGITMMNGVPTQWALVLDRADVEGTDFSGLRIAAMGAAAAPPELIRRLRETLGCPVLNGYSATEAGVISGTVIGDPDEVVAGTVGRPRAEVDLRIVDPDTGHALPAGQVGEVVCRSPAMMRGYWRDPELTATVIDADGFLHTGDLGRLRADGNLTLAGRLKEMYIRGGYNVYPTEVEAVLTDHPAIARAAVIGAPDPVLGEIGVAFVVPDTSSGTPGSATVPDRDTLRAWCTDRIADYKAPDRVVVVDELPVTAVGKLDKNALATRWADQLAAEAATTPADPAGGHR
ncbi:MAG: class I adenylate-forming enzyme family protein [Acidimicrobiia bacterium]